MRKRVEESILGKSKEEYGIPEGDDLKEKAIDLEAERRRIYSLTPMERVSDDRKTCRVYKKDIQRQAPFRCHAKWEELCRFRLHRQEDRHPGQGHRPDRDQGHLPGHVLRRLGLEQEVALVVMITCSDNLMW